MKRIPGNVLAILAVPIVFTLAVVAAYAWGPAGQLSLAAAAEAPATAVQETDADANAADALAHEVTIPALAHAVERMDPVTVADLPVEKGELSYAPYAAAPITRDHRAHVQIDLEVVETTMEIADGVTYDFWTFGGSVPGPMIRVREGDYVSINLQNHPESRFPHNIDLHSVAGQGGGAEATLVMPGQQAGFGFAALTPGVYVYHCATAPVGMHVANGMYGLIVVDPAEGWEPVDQEYYVVQGDFYTPGNFGETGHQPFDMERAIDEDASYVVFNGRVGSMTGENAPTAKVGEKVRMFVGNGGPNLVSSFHVIGEIFDNVYDEGGTNVNHNVQTTMVPAGGSSVVEMTFDVPATYILVDHSIFRAFNKGALGTIVVTGEENDELFNAFHDVRPYAPDGD